MVKKKDIERARKARKKQLEKVTKLWKDIEIPKISRSFTTSHYKSFLKDIRKKPVTRYEKACAFSEKIFPISPNEKMKKEIAGHLDRAFINATPKGVLSLTMILTILTGIFSSFLIIMGAGFTFGILLLFLTGGVLWYFYSYPKTRARVTTLKMSADSIIAILYMVIYMRSSPNLEGALRFASENLEGPLAWDFKKLLWDIEVGKYTSADEALATYSFKWRDENKPFSEALQLLRGSSVHESRRKLLFDEIISNMLTGTKNRAKRYVTTLRMPIMMINALGVLLPIMGLILFPVVLIFISDVVKPISMIIGYNVVLPALLFFFIDYILQKKPPTFSEPDISNARGIPPMGKFVMFKRTLPVLPFALLCGMPIALYGLYGLLTVTGDATINYSFILLTGTVISIIAYCILDTFQKTKIRKDIERIEEEFNVALFQLGNAMSGGVPIEIALDIATKKMKNLEISKMFEIASLNMKKFGYTFEQAFFDEEVGVIWQYPSKLIESVMRTVIESSKKGITSTGESMLVISNYLKNIKELKEEVSNVLGETISSIKFVAMFLSPIISGVTVTMAIIILKILTSLGSSLENIMGASSGVGSAQGLMMVPWVMGGAPAISPSLFQLIVGIYMVQISIILAIFLNRIEYGDDAIGIRQTIWVFLLIAIVIYLISWSVTNSMFGTSITSLLTPVT